MDGRNAWYSESASHGGRSYRWLYVVSTLYYDRLGLSKGPASAQRLPDPFGSVRFCFRLERHSAPPQNSARQTLPTTHRQTYASNRKLICLLARAFPTTVSGIFGLPQMLLDRY